jgi:hypothetical protein
MDNLEATSNEDIETNDSSDDSSDDKVSLRDSLNRAFSADDERKSVERGAPEEKVQAQETPQAQTQERPQEAAQVERIPVVPPADMNKLEREAFLNPTAENQHIIQQYINRRSYETRSEYQKKVVELDQIKAQNQTVYDTIQKYEKDYAKRGIRLADVAERSILWDQAMQENPVQSALEWLDSYGLTINDLLGSQGGQPYQQDYSQEYQQPSYLTREEAERIAEEKLTTAMQAQREEQERNAVAYYNERVVESFTASKPLFRDPETASQLEAEMAPIVQALTGTGRYSSPEEILETAYNYVVAGNPTFSSLQSAMTAKSRIEHQAAEAQRAKAASTSISGSAGTGTPRMKIKDLRDNLQRRLSGSE